MKVLNKLIAQAIDYAGLFPPASLSMTETVANFRRYRYAPSRGMLGRLVVPISRLNELRQSIQSSPYCPSSPQSDSCSFPELESLCRLSALIPADSNNQYADFHQSLSALVAFNQQYMHHDLAPMIVDSIEIKIDSTAELQKLAGLVPATLDTFFEIDCHQDPTATLSALARLRQGTETNSEGQHLFAKIRTGSVIAEQIPSIELVSRFIAACARNFVPFKATAGLHHPLRNEYRLTYQPDAVCGTMHGFINMFVASLCAYEYQLSEQEIAEILQEREPANFHFEGDRIQWHHLTISLERIEPLRQESIQSFGSCSFEEPTEELCELFQCQFS